MKEKIIFLSIIFVSLLTTGCGKILEFFQNSAPGDPNAVLDTNPKYVPKDYTYTYKIVFDKYDILVDTLIVTKEQFITKT